MKTNSDVTAYINSFTGETRSRLQYIRKLVHDEAPDATENMSYGLAGYKLNGKPLIYFGGFTHHIGFYATPNGHEAFQKEFSKYKQGKGSVQFPLDQPLPEELIRNVTKFRIEKVG